MVAGATDFADGFIAKRFGTASLLGSFLDPMADKFLVGTLALTMAYKGIVPAWVVGVVVARDVLLISGTVLTCSLLAKVAGA
jgi:cardiolipin synthase